MQYGSFETIKAVATQDGKTVYLGGNNTAQPFAIKVYDQHHVTGGEPEQVEVFNNTFYGSVELQKKAAVNSKFIAPVFEYGVTGDSAWYVTKFYNSSAANILADKLVLPRESIVTLVRSITQGALHLKRVSGRSHGNLKPSNVLLTLRKGQITQAVLTDPAPGGVTQADNLEVADLRSVGHLIYKIVHRYESGDSGETKIAGTEAPPQWKLLFGADAQAWFAICRRLLAPDLTTHIYSLEQLADDLPGSKMFARPAVLSAGVAVLVILGALAGVLAWKHSRSATSPTPVTMDVVKRHSNDGKSPPLSNVTTKEPLPTTKDKIVETTTVEAQLELEDDLAAKDRVEAEALRRTTEVKAKALAAEKEMEEARRRKADATREAQIAAEAAEKVRQATLKSAEQERVRKETEEKRLAMEITARELKRQLAAREKEAEAIRLAARSIPETTSPLTLATVETPAHEADSANAAKPRAGSKWSNSLGMKFAPITDGHVLISIWETRRKDYEEFARANRQTFDSSWKKTAFSQTASHPVVNVSVAEADAFCQWLTKTERQKGLLEDIQFYRLPTDAEWSFAATAIGNPASYLWGNAWPPPAGIANYSSTCTYDRFQATATVGQFLPNKNGLFDLSGNVWEMCQPSRGSNKTICRGASWKTYSPEEANLSYRLQLEVGQRREDVGFRCVLDTGN